MVILHARCELRIFQCAAELINYLGFLKIFFMKLLLYPLVALTLAACSTPAPPLPPICQETKENIETLIKTLEADKKIPDYYIKAHQDNLSKITLNTPRLEEAQKEGYCRFFNLNTQRISNTLTLNPRGMDAEIQRLHEKGNF